MIYTIVGLIYLMLIWKKEDSLRDDYGELRETDQQMIGKLYLVHLIYTVLTIIIQKCDTRVKQLD